MLIITESKGFPPQRGYGLKLQGSVSALAGHIPLTPKGGWSLNRGIRGELHAAPHLRLGTEYVMLLSFMEGRESCIEGKRQMCS